MKTEPSVFSFDDLARAKDKTAPWDGVRNYQARNFMRDEFKLGDLAFIYHSSIPEPAIIGIAEVTKEAYPDHTASEPGWVMVNVRAKSRFSNPVSLAQLKKTRGLAGMLVIKRGVRLSIQPVSPKEWQVIERLGAPVTL